MKETRVGMSSFSSEELHFFVEKLNSLTHPNPHLGLGLKEDRMIHFWSPGQEKAWILFGEEKREMKKVHPKGLFCYQVSQEISSLAYQLVYPSGYVSYDPYNFTPTLEEDLFSSPYFFLYRKMGATLAEFQKVKGTLFSLFAPNAKGASVLGDFNNWDARVHPMKKDPSGLFLLFIPGIGVGQRYKFELSLPKEIYIKKTDPFALYFDKRPKTSSIVYDVDGFAWKDALWLQQRKKQNYQKLPMNIYEVHLGSWRKKERGFFNYRELAHDLGAYLKKMHFNYLEILPIMEHPLDESWGYQTTGFFAPTSRYGTPEDFQYFVDHMHSLGIGVIIDWSAAHFPSDEFALVHFDGTHLFEYEDPKKGFHPQWNSLIFDYTKREVRNFLISSALFWCEKMHVDGIRVDAVSSMLRLDFARKKGEWEPNALGEPLNLEAIEFLQEFTSTVHHHFPEVILIAEEATDFKGVTAPVEKGGLGFDLKWNMGWMNDTLRYFSTKAPYRSKKANLLTFKMQYDYDEKFLCPLSHDEVVHGKKSLLEKMPGTEEEKLAQLRLLYSYMLCSTGKNLIFMGAELGQKLEWNDKDEISWELLQEAKHKKLHFFFQKMNLFYQQHPALWENDFIPKGFCWQDLTAKEEGVFSYFRKARKEELLILHHFGFEEKKKYFLPVSSQLDLKIIFSTDEDSFGGRKSPKKKPKIVYTNQKEKEGLVLDLPPLVTLIFEVMPCKKVKLLPSKNI